MIVYGGRDAKNVGIHEIWGLRKHRNGVWDWTKPPKGNNYSLKGR